MDKTAAAVFSSSSSLPLLPIPPTPLLSLSPAVVGTGGSPAAAVLGLEAVTLPPAARFSSWVGTSSLAGCCRQAMAACTSLLPGLSASASSAAVSRPRRLPLRISSLMGRNLAALRVFFCWVIKNNFKRKTGFFCFVFKKIKGRWVLEGGEERPFAPKISAKGPFLIFFLKAGREIDRGKGLCSAAADPSSPSLHSCQPNQRAPLSLPPLSLSPDELCRTRVS